MRRMLALSGIFLLLCFALYGEWLVHEDIGFQVEVPDTWESFDEEGVLMAMDPEEAAAVFLIPVSTEEFDDAVDELETTLGEIFDEIDVSEEPEETEINGMPGIMVFGSGVMEEEPVVWGVVIAYNEETGIALFTITFVLAEFYEEYESLVLDILSSVSVAENEAG